MIHAIQSLDKAETGLDYQKITREVSRYISTQLIPMQAQPSDKNGIYRLLQSLTKNDQSGLKPRNKNYIRERVRNFTVIKNDKEIIACGEMIDLDERTIELGAMGTHPEHQNKWLSAKILERAEWFAEKKGKDIILVTDNENLMRTLWKRWYTNATHLYRKRHAQSPTKKIYMKKCSWSIVEWESSLLSTVHDRMNLLIRKLRLNPV